MLIFVRRRNYEVLVVSHKNQNKRFTYDRHCCPPAMPSLTTTTSDIVVAYILFLVFSSEYLPLKRYHLFLKFILSLGLPLIHVDTNWLLVLASFLITTFTISYTDMLCLCLVFPFTSWQLHYRNLSNRKTKTRNKDHT